MTEDQYHKIRNQLWLVGFLMLIISTIEMLIFHTWALYRIEAMQCKCNNFQVSANGNTSSVNVTPDQERMRLVEKVLIQQGKLNGQNSLRSIADESGRSSSGTNGVSSGISSRSSTGNPNPVSD